jgi:hypothetical protein
VGFLMAKLNDQYIAGDVRHDEIVIPGFFAS